MNVDLPEPGAPADPDADGSAGRGSSASSTRSARAWWSRTRGLDQRDGLGQRPRLTRQHAIDELLVGGLQQGLAGHGVFHRRGGNGEPASRVFVTRTRHAGRSPLWSRPRPETSQWGRSAEITDSRLLDAEPLFSLKSNRAGKPRRVTRPTHAETRMLVRQFGRDPRSREGPVRWKSDYTPQFSCRRHYQASHLPRCWRPGEPIRTRVATRRATGRQRTRRIHHSRRLFPGIHPMWQFVTTFLASGLRPDPSQLVGPGCIGRTARPLRIVASCRSPYRAANHPSPWSDRPSPGRQRPAATARHPSTSSASDRPAVRPRWFATSAPATASPGTPCRRGAMTSR